jgi:hypothetical protein
MVNLELNLRSSENEKPQDVEKIVATALRTLTFSPLQGVDKPKYTVPPPDRRRNRMKNLIENSPRHREAGNADKQLQGLQRR